MESVLGRIARITGIIAAVALFHLTALAQASPATSRITQRVDESRRVPVPGNVHPLAQARFDRGRAPADLPMDRMLLLLKRAPEQDAALRTRIQNLHDGASPLYHHWLTPAEFGQLYGPADADILTVTNWLAAHGFHDLHLSPGRTSIEFSGNALQVESAFSAAIHKYVVANETHWANATDPQIPAALTPVIAGVATLHNFFPKPYAHLSKQRHPAQIDPLRPGHPLFTSGTLQSLVPADLGVIYNINPLYAAGIDGSGATIAIVASSNIDVSDVQDFRRVLALPPNDPHILLNGPDPGLVQDADIEAILDTEWSGALAPKANIDLVVSADTNAAFGFELSEQYIVDHNLAHIMSESFGACESFFTASDAAGILARAQQAAAQGITIIVASGDSGAAGCDQIDGTLLFTTAVSAPASTPYAVAVGGTQFNEGANPSQYWNATNDSQSGSARSYIPEVVWNESCQWPQCFETTASASGGGPSTWFPKPSWQSGVPGIPNDNSRDVPDLALTAAASHDPYLLCVYGSCQSNPEGTVDFYSVGGTSAATPSFAGIMALIDQKTGSRQGIANTVLYRLAAAENLSVCDASNALTPPASTCVFNDVTAGNNAVPGESGYGASNAKFQAAPGYDLATGLGSVNAANLVNQWTSIGFSPTATTLVIAPTHLVHGSAVNLAIQVKGAADHGTPSGLISLLTSNGQGLGSYPLLNGQALVNTTALPFGAYGVLAHYAGDGLFAPSDSALLPVSILFNPAPTTTSEQIFTVDASDNPVPVSSITYGSYVSLNAAVASTSAGILTGAVNFVDNGTLLAGDPYPLTASRTTSTPHGFFNLIAGQHSVVASYSGDTNFGSSTSAPVTFTITQAPVNITASANLLQAAPTTPVQFTVTVTPAGNGDLPTGSVSFQVGGVLLGTAPLVLTQPTGFGYSGFLLGWPQPVMTATFTTTALPLGLDSVAATYNGDLNYLRSTTTSTVLVQSAVFHQDFPKTSVLTKTLSAVVLSYRFDAAVGLPSFSTRYARDFLVSSTTCTPNGQQQVCSVTVLFGPKTPGLRQDALLATTGDTASTRILAVTSLAGIGDGPQAVVSPGTVSIVAGGGTNKGVDGLGDGGPATGATLSQPGGIAVDPLGNIFICDTFAGLVRKVDHASGIITVIAGTGAFANSGDGGPATKASIGWPSALAIDAVGNLYIADFVGTSIRRIDALTGIISTVPFADPQPIFILGIPGIVGSPELSSLAVDPAGDLYVGLGPLAMVMKLSLSSGTATRVAGTGIPGDGGDGGPATQAQLRAPSALALDSAGNLYIGDSLTYTVRKVDAITGVITTVAGTKDVSGSSGDGGPATSAQLSSIVGLAVDPAGDLYLSDPFRSSIRKVDGRGIISTIFAAAFLAPPSGTAGAISLDANGSLYAADPVRSVIRQIQSASATVSSPLQLPATLSNVGTQPLAIYAFSNTPDAATAVACSTQKPLAPGSSCLIEGPLTPGPVTVTDDSLDQTATQQFIFNGILFVPVPSFTATSNAPDFGPQALFIPSRPSPVTISNTGTTPFSVFTTIAGPNPSDFSFTSDCPALLAGGQTCTIYVTFIPQVAATRIATLQIAINGKSYVSPFTFTGIGGGVSACTVYNFSASPLPVIAASGTGSTVVHVDADCAYDLRIGGPAGPLFASAAGPSDSPTGTWVVDGTAFYLQPLGSVSAAATLGVLQIPVLGAACTVNAFQANPGSLSNTALASATITADAKCAYDVRIGGPGGQLFATAAGAHSLLTGLWVTDGMTFYLQLSGNTTSAGTLALATVHLTANGCVVYQFDDTADSPGLVTANASCAYDIRIGAPTGALLISGNGATSTPASNAITRGTTLFLQIEGDQTSAGTLARFTLPLSPNACAVHNFTALPNPLSSASGLASAAIEIDADCPYDVRVNAPAGALLTSGEGASAVPTGNWVTDGTLFYLQPKGNTTPAATLRSIRVGVVSKSTN